MASLSTLEIFNPDKETVDDYKERFDFHCIAHDIPQRQWKVLFLTRIGWDTFAKLKTLVSPTSLDDLSLTDIVMAMKQHYKKNTVEIAERFKFFKRVQCDNEEVAEYVAELRKLAILVTISIQPFVTSLSVAYVTRKHRRSYYVYKV